jgi:hypothetical protein
MEKLIERLNEPAGKYDEVLRPFVALMEKELHANAGKGDRPGWLAMSRETVMLEIYYHTAKLAKAVRDNHIPNVCEYAADVANMAMMAVDVCGALTLFAPSPTQAPAGVGEREAFEDKARRWVDPSLCMNPHTTIVVGQKVIVTTDNWFYAPDGRQYRAAFGTVHGVDTAEASLGVKPNGRSTNWYLRIGRLVIAGCQIHYVLRADSCSFKPAPDWQVHEGRVVEYDRPSAVFDADAT